MSTATYTVSGAPLPLNINGIPDELRIEPRWLPYRLNGRRKVPQGLDGRPCDPHNPSHWRDFDGAVEPYFRERAPTSGVVFALDDSGYVVKDRDRILLPDGTLSPAAIRDSRDDGTRTLLSPLAGLHSWFRGEAGANRRFSRYELLARGVVTVTGHVLHDRPMQLAGPDLLRALRTTPESADAPFTPAPTPVPLYEDIVGTPHLGATAPLLIRMMTHPKAWRLWRGDWSGYRSRSEAYLALARYGELNEGTHAEITAVLIASGLPRDRRRTERYFAQIAAKALATARPRAVFVAHGQPKPNPTIAAENGRRAELVAALRAHPTLGPVADMLVALAADLSSRFEHGKDGTDVPGSWCAVSTMRLSGDYRPVLGLPAPKRTMSKKTARRHLVKAAELGAIELKTERQRRAWLVNGMLRSSNPRCSFVRVAGSDFASILAGYLRTQDRTPTPLYEDIVGTPVSIAA